MTRQRESWAAPDPWQGLRRLQRTTKRLTDGSLSGATNLASPLSNVPAGAPLVKPAPEEGSGGGGRYPATLTVAASDASALSIASADAVCDGTNDEVEIKAALTECFDLGGGRVLLTEGTFNLSDVGVASTGSQWANCWLQGQGMDATILAQSGVSNSQIFFVFGGPFHISDLTLDGTAVDASGPDGLDLDSALACTVIRVRFRAIGGTTVCSIGHRARVIDCEFVDLKAGGGYGLRGPAGADDVIVRGCYFEDVQSNGIILDDRAIVVGNHVRFDNADGGSTDAVTVGDNSIVVGNILEGYLAPATVASGAGSQVANNVLL